MVLTTGAAAEQRLTCGRGFIELCTWAATIPLAAVPPDALKRACLVLADDIAAIVAAATEPEVAAVQEELARSAGTPAATVLGRTPVRVDRHTAAAANGMAICWTELDEGYRVVACHAGAYIIPAMLAEAEASGALTRDLIASLAVAYEVTANRARLPRAALARAFKWCLRPARCGRRGRPAKGLRGEGLRSRTLLCNDNEPCGALQPRSSRCARAQRLARDRRLGRLSCGGLGSAWHRRSCRDRLRRDGDVLWGHACVPDRLTSGLGSNWAISSGYHKMVACCQYAHSAVEATLFLRAQNPALADPANISDVVVATHPMGETLATREPETVLAGKFSMLHAVATAAIYGSAGASAFARGSLADPAVAGLRRRIRLLPHEDVKPWPKDRPARVEITFTEGRRISANVDSARGGPDDPFSEPELRAKIAALTADLYPSMAPRLARLETSTCPWRDDLTAMLAQRAK
jgi:2-methylcitrate dehydratase PrpD